jgi:hypothetical protein
LDSELRDRKCTLHDTQDTRRWYVSTARQLQAARRYKNRDDDDDIDMRAKDISEMRLPPNVNPDGKSK